MSKFSLKQQVYGYLVNRKLIILCSLTIYFISLFLCNVHLYNINTGDNSCDNGAIIMIANIFTIPEFSWIWWLSCSLYIFSLALFKKEVKLSFYFSALACLVSLTFFFFIGKNIRFPLGDSICVVDSFGLGYYFWIISIFLITISSYLKIKDFAD
jgi:hypothetical protein